MKKEETCVNHHEVKESKTTKKFSKFMEMHDKKLKLLVKNLEIKIASNNSKMLFVNVLD
ncbi:hypothetical protein ZWY2020_005150 [Hordeum vulgare]|nr:hypothetical protein ZWY2020_005150 [Hordeum vulgare]